MVDSLIVSGGSGGSGSVGVNKNSSFLLPTMHEMRTIADAGMGFKLCGGWCMQM